MKKWLIIIGVLTVILGIVAFDSKFYYPTLPIESVSKKEVLESLNDTSEDIVKIAEENGYEWYITPMEPFLYSISRILIFKILGRISIFQMYQGFVNKNEQHILVNYHF